MDVFWMNYLVSVAAALCSRLTWLMSMRASQLSGCVAISPFEPITVESRPRSLIFWMVVPSTK
ncbi:hypothetical protein EYF80_055202 [Liparis tanakae]|uniref:Uncharacterized protein n=1 Tax=Liparis tanakae TaxID=230148 RepID=A0A4Z2F0T3_9TELE|nr:hypothetical protein EYF80_055202 [Liparis tanakae]